MKQLMKVNQLVITYNYLFMKKNLLNLILLVCSNILTAQELPEIPMKNGMAYYSFVHKLDNSKKCLKKYFGTTTFNLKIGNSINQINSKSSGIFKGKQIFLSGFIPLNDKCIDTLNNPTGFSLSKTEALLWDPSIIEVKKIKITASSISSEIDVIFLSKNEYKIVFKDLTYKIMSTQGFDLHSIGELYQKLKTTNNASKSDLKFFEDLNFCIKAVDELILKALTETYKADEL